MPKKSSPKKQNTPIKQPNKVKTAGAKLDPLTQSEASNTLTTVVVPKAKSLLTPKKTKVIKPQSLERVLQKRGYLFKIREKQNARTSLVNPNA